MPNIYRLFVPFLVLLLSTPTHGQGTEVQFGKNRVQFHQDFADWSYYETQNFITYWYGEGRRVGQLSVQLAELDFYEIQNLLEHRFNDKTEIIVYTDITDLKQSNLGSEETFVNSGGQTKIVGNKVFVYFDGNHQHLRQAIREGIATVFLNAMLFGSNIQEIVQNAVLLNLPEWFKDGLVAFVGSEWNAEVDDQLRNILKNEKYLKFEKLVEDHPKLAGHSMWNFISQNYGKSTVSNLLYLTRINRSIDSGLLYVLGSSFEKMAESWQAFYTTRYAKDHEALGIEERTPIKLKNRKKARISTLKVSPDGNKIAYVLNEIGKKKVYVQDIATGERKKVLKDGYRNPFQETDYNYPLLAWNPNNQQLAILYERRDLPLYFTYDLTSHETVQEPLDPQLQRVNSMEFINTSQVLFSATARGISDLFIYRPLVRQTERITNDFWDDLNATVVNLRGKKGIIFSSNRQDTTIMNQRPDSILPINNFDLFYYDLENRPEAFVRLTNTPLANEWYPVAVDSMYFSYLSDKTGIVNRYAGYLDEIFHYNEQVIVFADSTELILHEDSTFANKDSLVIDRTYLQEKLLTIGFSHPISDYPRSTSAQHYSEKSGIGYEVIPRERKGEKIDKVFQFTIMPDSITEPAYTTFRKKEMDRLGLSTNTTGIKSNGSTEPSNSSTIPTPITTPTEKEDVVIDPGMLFQSEFGDEPEKPDAEEAESPTVILEEDNSKILNRPIGKTPSDVPAVRPSIGETFIGQRFNPSRIVPYRLKFKTDFVTTKLDNSLLFGGLDNFAAVSPNDPGSVTSGEQIQGYSPPPLGILMKANVKDLFEDYTLEGGIRIPTTFNGAEYFLFFDNNKKRLDKRFALYRRNMRRGEVFNLTTNILERREESTNLGQVQLKYPLDIFTSIRAIGTIRFDKRTKLATDSLALKIPTERSQRIGARVEYVFDNTLDVSENIKNGTRYKAYAEVVKKFAVDLENNFSFNFSNGFMTILGFDARHYQRLDKKSIIAFRAAGATSFGSEQQLYYLGGVNNWLLPKFDESIPFPTGETGDNNYAFQTLASNLRGFKTNIRNGNTYVLANAELRVPFLNYFFKRLQSPLLRNLQAIAFFDVGAAWEGKFRDPNSPINSTSISPPNTGVTVTVNYFRDPIVAGFGFGLRTTVFGYFVKVDWAKGIETRELKDRIIYLSLGKDF